MSWAQFIGVAATSAVGASALTSIVSVWLARQQREHERERDREGLRRDVYARYLLFAERLPDRWLDMMSDLTTFEKALSQAIEEKREVEVPLRLTASPKINDLLFADAEAAFDAFMEAFVAEAPPTTTHPTRRDLEAAAYEARDRHWRPFVKRLIELMAQELGSA